MAGNCLSPAERTMRETIEFLLRAPPEERERMELAQNFDFTVIDKEQAIDADTPISRSRSAMITCRLETASGATSRLVTLALGTVEAAAMLCRRGWWPAVLNFAHGYNCGGGFEHSGGSQEEAIFRDTSLFLSLWPHRRPDDGPGVLARGMWIGEFDDALPRKEAFYPHNECSVIYSPHVSVVRKLHLPDHPLVEDVASAPTIAVLTAAAQDCGRDPPFKAPLLREKCRAILRVAAEKKHTSLVLGAFGCGYFRNPPEDVADTFSSLLAPDDAEFANIFRLVVFAMPSIHDRNFSAFAQRFRVVDDSNEDWLINDT